jgi:hypothetical protein
LRLALAAVVALLTLAPIAHADTPTPRTSWPYAQWLSTAAPRVPSAADINPGVHRHIIPECDFTWALGCTSGYGEIWLRAHVFDDYARWRRIYHHEIAHNVDAQHLLDGHHQHFMELTHTDDYHPNEWAGYHAEFFAEFYAQCALNGPPMGGVTQAEHNAVCGWLERAPWGVRYW